MKYYFLASGSKGNCRALVNDNQEILLFDCGIAINDIKLRLESVGLKYENIKKVLITHMHIDHVKSLRAFEPKDVYLNVINDMREFNQFDYYESFEVLGFNVYTLPASHDSPGTTGFLIEYKGEKMAFITDTGYIHENTQTIINNCDIYCIESNHDPRLLMLTNRPMFLKNRILSIKGHMSNKICGEVLNQVIEANNLKKIILAHLSEECNTEELAVDTVLENINSENIPEMYVAKQWVALPLLEV